MVITGVGLSAILYGLALAGFTYICKFPFDGYLISCLAALVFFAVVYGYKSENIDKFKVTKESAATDIAHFVINVIQTVLLSWVVLQTLRTYTMVDLRLSGKSSDKVKALAATDNDVTFSLLFDFAPRFITSCVLVCCVIQLCMIFNRFVSPKGSSTLVQTVGSCLKPAIWVVGVMTVVVISADAYQVVLRTFYDSLPGRRLTPQVVKIIPRIVNREKSATVMFSELGYDFWQLFSSGFLLIVFVLIILQSTRTFTNQINGFLGNPWLQAAHMVLAKISHAYMWFFLTIYPFCCFVNLLYDTNASSLKIFAIAVTKIFPGPLTVALLLILCISFIGPEARMIKQLSQPVYWVIVLLRLGSTGVALYCVYLTYPTLPKHYYWKLIKGLFNIFDPDSRPVNAPMTVWWTIVNLIILIVVLIIAIVVALIVALVFVASEDGASGGGYAGGGGGSSSGRPRFKQFGDLERISIPGEPDLLIEKDMFGYKWSWGGRHGSVMEHWSGDLSLSQDSYKGTTMSLEKDAFGNTVLKTADKEYLIR